MAMDAYFRASNCSMMAAGFDHTVDLNAGYTSIEAVRFSAKSSFITFLIHCLAAHPAKSGCVIVLSTSMAST